MFKCTAQKLKQNKKQFLFDQTFRNANNCFTKRDKFFLALP